MSLLNSEVAKGRAVARVHDLAAIGFKHSADLADRAIDDKARRRLRSASSPDRQAIRFTLTLRMA